jgi:CRP-like cAMP-binding protein
LWLEPLPAVELADRLRKIPLFGFASVDELFRIAGLGRQVRHEAGRVLYERGRGAETLQVLLDGRVTIEDAKRPRMLEAPAILAFENVLEGSPMDVNIRAAEPSICLSLTVEEFLSLLSENVEIAQGIFRLLIETRGECFGAGDAAEGERIAWDSVLRGSISADLQRRVADGIQAVELVLLLQTSPLLSRATSSQLIALANIARPITLKPGSDPLVGLEPSIIVVLTGAVRVERDGHAVETANSGDMVGVAETLGGMPFSSRAEVVTEGRGLRFGRAELFDVLADNIELLQGIFSGLLRARTTKVHA